MSVYNDCRDCKKYQGNCGHHHVDHSNGHINYNIPAEAWMDNVIGSHGSCFEPSQQYLDACKKERVDAIIKQYSSEELEAALEVIKHERQTPKEPVRTIYTSHDFTTIGYCPTCGNQVVDGIGGGDKKCQSCGQVLLWR